ncbi:adenosine kinase [Planosporangium sp. 12N6]|uniref:adenosine kinase n=1 Tax=Planosporangium spinosum TaxID=3402278 RepID=UPI003CE67D83
MADRCEVLVLGGAGVDTVVYVPELPLPMADSYHVPAIRTRAGQTGDGVALGLTALGARTALVDVVGDDPEGDLVRALHARHGVAFTGIATPAGTKRAVNLVDPAGRRLSLYDSSRGHEADRLPVALVADLAAGARHVHVSITHPCRHALATVRASGRTVSTDLHNWDGVEPYHEAFAYEADIVFLSTAALSDHGATMRRILARGRARVVVATAGAAGGYVLARGEAAPRRYPAVAPPVPAVDSNGAGDAFVAGFLLGALAGEPVETCVRYGSVAGAHACTVPSTEVGPIDRATLLARSRAVGTAPA